MKPNERCLFGVHRSLISELFLKAMSGGPEVVQRELKGACQAVSGMDRSSFPECGSCQTIALTVLGASAVRKSGTPSDDMTGGPAMPGWRILKPA